MYKLPTQPIPVIVGTDPENYACYVSINGILYKTENVLKTVDVCFKAFISLNAQYPPDAEPSWMFLQQGIYDIYTKSDKKYSSVQSLIADIKISLNSYCS